jgi:Eco57I restriction-modification methylase
VDDADFLPAVESVLTSKSWQEQGFRMAFKAMFYRGEPTDGLQNVHTPFDLCHQMLTKLSEFVDLKRQNILVMFNLEFLDVLIHDFKIHPINITFLTDSPLKAQAAREWYGGKEYCRMRIILDTEINNKQKMLRMKKQFDVSIGNPPYQGTSGNKGKGNILWDKFVALSDDELVADGGYLCFVHPALWRKPNHPLQRHFLHNDLQYLEIHDERDGQQTFGVNTRYDWYVLRKVASRGKTIVKAEDGQLITIDLRDWSFIPNCEFQLVKKLLADRVEDRVIILHSESAYEPRKNWMSTTQDDKHKYPCVYMVRMNNEPVLKWSSRNDKGHFGQPKVIYGIGSGQGFFVDDNGQYGMTQWCGAIVDEPENLGKIAEALKSDRFRQFSLSLSLRHEINPHILRLFRKDFWKEFA